MSVNSSLLEPFVGRFCTIFTVGINRDFKAEIPENLPETMHRYFTGRLVAYDDQGLVIENIMDGLPAYFTRQHIVSIAQEQEITDPQEIEKAKAAHVTLDQAREEAGRIEEEERRVAIAQAEAFNANGGIDLAKVPGFDLDGFQAKALLASSAYAKSS